MMAILRQRFLLCKVETIKISINTCRNTKMICTYIYIYVFLPRFSIFKLRNLEANKILLSLFYGLASLRVTL